MSSGLRLACPSARRRPLRLDRVSLLLVFVGVPFAVYALLVLTVAAAEAAIGLAVLVVYYRNRGSIAVEDINSLKG